MIKSIGYFLSVVGFVGFLAHLGATIILLLSIRLRGDPEYALAGSTYTLMIGVGIGLYCIWLIGLLLYVEATSRLPFF